MLSCDRVGEQGSKYNMFHPHEASFRYRAMIGGKGVRDSGTGRLYHVVF